MINVLSDCDTSRKPYEHLNNDKASLTIARLIRSASDRIQYLSSDNPKHQHDLGATFKRLSQERQQPRIRQSSICLKTMLTVYAARRSRFLTANIAMRSICVNKLFSDQQTLMMVVTAYACWFWESGTTSLMLSNTLTCVVYSSNML
jgi:hypothetical protein